MNLNAYLELASRPDIRSKWAQAEGHAAGVQELHEQAGQNLVHECALMFRNAACRASRTKS